jgi:hypothetical protein
MQSVVVVSVVMVTVVVVIVSVVSVGTAQVLHRTGHTSTTTVAINGLTYMATPKRGHSAMSSLPLHCTLEVVVVVVSEFVVAVVVVPVVEVTVTVVVHVLHRAAQVVPTMVGKVTQSSDGRLCASQNTWNPTACDRSAIDVSHRRVSANCMNDR